MKKVSFLVVESIDGGYMAKALGESIYTEVNNIEELKSFDFTWKKMKH